MAEIGTDIQYPRPKRVYSRGVPDGDVLRGL